MQKTWPQGENMVIGAKGAKVKIIFQGLHMTRVIFMLVYNFKFCILNTLFNLHLKYEYILTKILFYIMYIMHSWALSHKYEQHLLKPHFQNP